MRRKIPQVVQEGFQYCIDQDFNPDEVYCYGIDMYNAGLKRGALCALGSVIILGIAGGIGRYIADRQEQP